MNHLSGVAVAVAEEIVHDKVPEHFVGIQRAFQIGLLRERLQGCDQTLLIGSVHGRFRVVEDVGIAARLVINVLQFDIAAAHAESAESAFAAFSVFAAAEHFRRVKVGEIKIGGYIAEVGHVTEIEVSEVRHVSKIEIPEIRHIAEIHAAFLLCAVLRIAGFAAVVIVPVHEIAHAEIFSVSGTAAAEAHAVRLVEVAEIAAVIALQEGFLDCLDRKIQTPVLAVDRDIHIAAKRGIRTEIGHQRICEVVLHVGVVLNDVVQAELIQSVVAFGLIVLVELDLEAVSAAARIPDRAEGGVSLAADADILHGFTVDDDRAGRIGFALAGFQERIPVADDNIERMYL